MIIPLRFNGRSLQGPYMSCVMTSETYLVRFSKSRSLSKPGSNLNCFSQTSIGKKQNAFNIYFTFGLVSCVMFFVLAVFTGLYYILANSFIRFQNKFLLLCVALHIHVFDCTVLNRYMILLVHLLMVLLGGLGFVVSMFIRL